MLLPNGWARLFWDYLARYRALRYLNAAGMAETKSTTRRRRARVTPLGLALSLAIVGLVLIAAGLAWGVAPWVAMVVIGAFSLGAAFLVDSPRRGSGGRR